MRVGFIVATVVLVGACASIVDLDSSDPAPSGIASSGGTNGSSGAGSSAGSAGQSSGTSTGTSSSSSSGGAEAGADTGASTSGVPVPARCDRMEDCPKTDDAHDRCTTQHKCEDRCIEKESFEPCAPDEVPFGERCCIGLRCDTEGTFPRCKS